MSVTSSAVRPGLLGGIGWRVFNALQLLFTITWTSVLICFALMLLVLCAGRRYWPLRMAGRVWAPGLLSGSGARLELEGFEAIDFSRPYIVVACMMPLPFSRMDRACAHFPRARAVVMGAWAHSRVVCSSLRSRPVCLSCRSQSKAVGSSFPPQDSRYARA